MASMNKEEGSLQEKNDFSLIINKKIKKISKKLEKINKHENEKSAKGNEAKSGTKAALEDKQKILNSVLEIYNKSKQGGAKKEIEPPTNKGANQPIDTQTENYEEDIVNSISQFVLVHSVAHLADEKSLPIKVESFLGKPHLEALMKLWNLTFQMPGKFTLGSWKKQVAEFLTLFAKKSVNKIKDSEITYKTLATKLCDAFKETAFINTDVDCELKVEKPVEKEVKKEEVKEQPKPVETAVKPAELAVVKPVEKPKEVKVEKKEKHDWADEAAKDEEEEEKPKVTEKKTADEEENGEWNTVKSTRRAGRRRRGRRGERKY